MRILIAEDEEHLADGLRFNLEAEGYEVDVAHDGEQAIDRLADSVYDAVVLDVMMPNADGYSVARSMRDSGDFTPILMLTALGKPEQVLEGFDSGADDYLTKPFNLSIFLARLKGLLRRREWLQREAREVPSQAATDALDLNGRTVDFTNLELRHGATVTQLTLMEAKLLKFLIDNEGIAVSRKSILENVWGLREDTDTRAIDNFIVRLRRYIEDDPNNPTIVQTVRGVGYKFTRPADR